MVKFFNNDSLELAQEYDKDFFPATKHINTTAILTSVLNTSNSKWVIVI